MRLKKEIVPFSILSMGGALSEIRLFIQIELYELIRHTHTIIMRALLKLVVSNLTAASCLSGRS